ncbi:MAG: helicase HerA-like domain-containing protein [Nanoarchaeota archaeon]
MPYDIIIGRTEKEQKELGDKGLIFYGKSYVKMGQTSSLSNNILIDVAKAHTILISGKRGAGKSYSIGVFAEEIANLPESVGKNLAVLIFDTMGIFWTMKYPNYAQIDELRLWGMEPKGLPVKVYAPSGKFQEYKEKKIAVDYSFSIKPSELTADDWCNVFQVKITDNIGVLIEKILTKLKFDYDLNDIIFEIRKDNTMDQLTKSATENRFQAVKNWGLFDIKGLQIKDIIKGGQVSILDLSAYDDWNIKSLVVGIISKKLFNERVTARKQEETQEIEYGQHYLTFEREEKLEMPLVWIFLDEAHELLVKEGTNAALPSLIQLLREGRQPGISLVMATQQPGEIHHDVITQSDIVISHRITAKPDIEALNTINQTYLTSSILFNLNNLPKVKGAAIILDDNSERIYPIKVRPKMSWHGGETPSAVKVKRQMLQI